MATPVAVTLLRELSRQFEARSPAKLLAVARRHHIPATPNDIKEAFSLPRNQGRRVKVRRKGQASGYRQIS